MQPGFVKVQSVSEIASGKMKRVVLGEKEILIVNCNGVFFAIDAKCTHMGGDLSKGSLNEKVITCPRHGSQFDVTNGKVVSLPTFLFLHPRIKDLRSYQVKVDQGFIFIKS